MIAPADRFHSARTFLKLIALLFGWVLFGAFCLLEVFFGAGQFLGLDLSGLRLFLAPIVLPLLVVPDLLFGNAAAYIAASILGCVLAVAALVWGRPGRAERVLLALVLASVVVFPWLYRYEPAVVAAPGYTMRALTQLDLVGGVVKRSQAAAEHRPCTYTILGWDTDGTLYYQAACEEGQDRFWAYAPDRVTGSEPVTAAPLQLAANICSRAEILDGVRAQVLPSEAEGSTRALSVPGNGLVSKDGRWVGFVARHAYGPEDVLVLARSSGAPVCDLVPPASLPGRAPDLPDGRLLLVRGGVGSYELWAADPSGTRVERLAIPAFELREDANPSPAGHSLLLIRSHGQGENARRSLELYDLGAQRASVLVSEPRSGYGVDETSWSPDARQIAYTSDSNNQQGVFDIWLVDVSTGHLRELTRFAVEDNSAPTKASWLKVPRAYAAGMVKPGAHSLQWSRDGRWIAFAYVSDADAGPVIEVVDVTTGQSQAIPLPSGLYHQDEFAWTPDGQALLYLKRLGPGRSETFEMSLDGTRSVLAAEGAVIGPWSPDWRLMAFNVLLEGKPVESTFEVWLHDYAGRTSLPVVRYADLNPAGPTGGQPHWLSPQIDIAAGSPWSPNGQWLAFVACRGESGYVTWIAAVDGSALHAVAAGEFAGWLQ